MVLLPSPRLQDPAGRTERQTSNQAFCLIDDPTTDQTDGLTPELSGIRFAARHALKAHLIRADQMLGGVLIAPG